MAELGMENDHFTADFAVLWFLWKSRYIRYQICLGRQLRISTRPFDWIKGITSCDITDRTTIRKDLRVTNTTIWHWLCVGDNPRRLYNFFCEDRNTAPILSHAPPPPCLSSITATATPENGVYVAQSATHVKSAIPPHQQDARLPKRTTQDP